MVGIRGYVHFHYGFRFKYGGETRGDDKLFSFVVAVNCYIDMLCGVVFYYLISQIRYRVYDGCVMVYSMGYPRVDCLIFHVINMLALICMLLLFNLCICRHSKRVKLSC